MVKIIQAEFLFRKGQKQAKAGKWEKSISYFDRVLSLKPKNRGAFLYKAISLSKQNKFDEALSIIGESISLQPDNHANYLIRGMVYYDSGEYDKALGDFEESLNLSPENPLLKCYIALTLLKKNEKVKQAYAALLNDIQNTNPEFKARFMVLCESFLLQHKKDSMSLEDTMFHESYFKEKTFVSKFFDRWSYKLNQVYVFLFYIFNSTKRKHYVHCLNAEQRLHDGNLIKSIEEYKKALNYLYEYNDALDALLKIYFYQKEYESIAECFAKLKEYKKVLNLLSRKDVVEKSKESIISELKNHLPLVLSLGHYYSRTGNYREAINIFKITAVNFSDEFYYNYHLGLSYLGANYQEKALTYFLKAFQKINPNVAKLRLEEMIRVSKNY